METDRSGVVKGVAKGAAKPKGRFIVHQRYGFRMGPIPEDWQLVTKGEIRSHDMCWNTWTKEFIPVEYTEPEGYEKPADYYLLIRKCT